jgi:hypothetical protein
VTPRHIALVLASVAVLAMGVYLWSQVNTSPATADVSKSEQAPSPPPPSADEHPEKQPDRVAAKTPDRPKRDAQIRETSAPPPPPPAQDTSGTPDVVTDELSKPNPKLDAVMAEANKAYDRGDFDDAKTIALKVLAKDPTNVRMLRIAVSSACIDGDSTEAQKHYQVLPASDREQMKIRCARYGVSFVDK